MLNFSSLLKHNPHIDWVGGYVLNWGTHCHSHCLSPSFLVPAPVLDKLPPDPSAIYHNLGSFSKAWASALPL